MRYIEYSAIAPMRCNSLITKVAYDVNEHANNLSNWRQDYDQISSGCFYGSITELTFEGLQVFHEFTNQQLHQCRKTLADSIWLGITADSGLSSRVNGIALGDSDLICQSGNREFELITPKNNHIFGIVVQKKILLEMADFQGREIDEFIVAEHERIRIPKLIMVNLRFLLNRLLREASVLPGARLQQDLVMMFLLEVLKSQQPCKKITPSYKHRKQVVDRVRYYLDMNQDRAVTITELCDSVGTCRRTMQYSFESIIGISPIKYMRAIRLNGVRRSLLSMDRHVSVAEAAAKWGFMHLSQFAKDYRELFGERPSETLNRTAGYLNHKLGSKKVNPTYSFNKLKLVG